MTDSTFFSMYFHLCSSVANFNDIHIHNDIHRDDVTVVYIAQHARLSTRPIFDQFRSAITGQYGRIWQIGPRVGVPLDLSFRLTPPTNEFVQPTHCLWGGREGIENSEIVPFSAV